MIKALAGIYLMFKPRTNQKDVHNLALLREVSTKKTENQQKKIEHGQRKENEMTNHRTKPCFML